MNNKSEALRTFRYGSWILKSCENALVSNYLKEMTCSYLKAAYKSTTAVANLRFLSNLASLGKSLYILSSLELLWINITGICVLSNLASV